MGKVIIVNRVSTRDQNPKLQLKDCKEMAEKKGLEVIKVLEEHASAGKSKQKQIYEAERIAKKEEADILVWKYDRSFRNMKDFVTFMEKMYEGYGIRVYSVREEWVDMLWNIAESIHLSNIPEPWKSMVKDQMKNNWKTAIRIVGMIAEQEIRDKSARVKSALKKREGKPAFSYKGNKWGKPQKITKKVIDDVLTMKSRGHSVREIADSVYYYDKNKNLKKVSIGTVQKIINEKYKEPIKKPTG